MIVFAIAAALSLQAAATATPAAAPTSAPPAPRASDAVAADWVTIPDDEVLVMTIGGDRRVMIRLAPRVAPVHVANMRKLARAHWWDGGSIYRVQDNYVAQWGDQTEKKPLPPGIVANPAPEYVLRAAAPVARLGRPDPYSEWSGYSADGWPLAGRGGEMWVPHCYGMVGVGRDVAPSTGSGAELYAVIGHAPRHLDRNIAVVGRILEGVEHLSSLPRGTGDLGFYTDAEQGLRTPIVRVRLASDMPAETRPRFQYRAPGNARFAAYVKARENREPPFFGVPAGGADICNAAVPVRRAPAG